MTSSPHITDDRDRAAGALWGLFIGDALAMPVHWYYDTAALMADYGVVSDYLAPRNPHPDSILWRSSHRTDDPRYDILHDQAQFWGRRGIHYHQFLNAGENTLNLQLCRLLMHSLQTQGGYDPDHYLGGYIDFMTTPGSHNDTYVEEYHRRFFTHLAQGQVPWRCGGPEKHISGLIGLIPILVYLRNDPSAAALAARYHLGLTHLGARMDAAADLLIDTLQKVLAGEGVVDVLKEGIKAQHHRLLGHPFQKWLKLRDEQVVGRRVSTACYVEDAVPAVVYLALKYGNNFRQALVANTNLGGDNAHRGAVLGALLGAASGVSAIPGRWRSGIWGSADLHRLINRLLETPIRLKFNRNRN